MSKELQYANQMSLMADNLKKSAEITSEIMQDGYKADDTQALEQFIDGLTNSMKGLTKLIHDLMVLAETERIMKGGN